MSTFELAFEITEAQQLVQLTTETLPAIMMAKAYADDMAAIANNKAVIRQFDAPFGAWAAATGMTLKHRKRS